jgi:hypothetical protein
MVFIINNSLIGFEVDVNQLFHCCWQWPDEFVNLNLGFVSNPIQEGFDRRPCATVSIFVSFEVPLVT